MNRVHPGEAAGEAGRDQSRPYRGKFIIGLLYSSGNPVNIHFYVKASDI